MGGAQIGPAQAGDMNPTGGGRVSLSRAPGTLKRSPESSVLSLGEACCRSSPGIWSHYLQAEVKKIMSGPDGQRLAALAPMTLVAHRKASWKKEARRPRENVQGPPGRS